MASGGFDVDPALIRDSGRRISSAAQAMGGHVAAFQQQLAGYGQPWGQDMVGSLIGSCYQAISGDYNQAEDVTTQDVNRIRRALG